MRFRASIALFLLPIASVASAQVIEIGDDGSMRTYDGPTVFVGGGGQAITQPSATQRAAVDPFDAAASRHGLDPALLRALAWTESRGNNSAVSPKGALGIMQLMPGTAAELGVDPRDALSNVAGGAAYFARQLQTFKTVPLALAAYNAGPGAVSRYRGIPPYAETQAYVSRVMQRWGGGAKPALASLNKIVTPKPVILSDSLLIEVPVP